jgi:hypothetical protein
MNHRDDIHDATPALHQLTAGRLSAIQPCSVLNLYEGR